MVHLEFVEEGYAVPPVVNRKGDPAAGNFPTTTAVDDQQLTCRAEPRSNVVLKQG